MPDEVAAAFTDTLLVPEGTSPSYRQAAALNLKGEWTPARNELRTLLDTASTPQQVQRMQELLRLQ